MPGSWSGSPVGGEQAIGAQRIGPSRLWYWVAGAALVGSVACVVLGAFVWFSSFRRQIDQFQRGPLPGQTVLSFDSPGGYTVYFETDTGPGTEVHWGSGSDAAEDTVTLRPYSMSLVGVDGGEQILLRPYGSESSYTSGGHAGRAMRSFHIDTPGSYLLDIVGPPPPVPANVAVGRGTGQTLRVLAVTVPAALILFCGAVGLTAVVAVRRHRPNGCSRRPLGPGPPGPRQCPRDGSPTRAEVTSFDTGTARRGPSTSPNRHPRRLTRTRQNPRLPIPGQPTPPR